MTEVENKVREAYGLPAVAGPAPAAAEQNPDQEETPAAAEPED